MVDFQIRRRSFLFAAIATPVLLPGQVTADDLPVGSVTALQGKALAVRGAKEHDLHLGSGVEVLDVVRTGGASFLAMQLGNRTEVRLGSDSELMIDRYVVDIGGTFDLTSGAMVFDRPEGAQPVTATVKTVFGRIGVRGTRFFAGPSRGSFGVFVDRGSVEVSAAGENVSLAAGEGVDLSSSGIVAPGVRSWGQARINEAFASVGL